MNKHRTYIISTAIFMLLTLLIAFSMVSAKEVEPSENSSANTVDSTGFLTGPQAGNPEDIALNYLRQNKESLGLTSTDLSDVQVTDHYVSSHTGVTHIYFVQRLNGIEVFNGLINVNVMPDGRILSVGNRFVPDLRSQVAGQSAASVTAVEAVELAADHFQLRVTEPLQVINSLGGASQEVIVNDGGISQNEIPAKLVFDASTDQVRLAWNVIIYQNDSQHWWNVRVDANTGDILSQNDWVVHENFRDIRQMQAAQKTTESIAANESSTDIPFGPTPAADGSSYTVYYLPVESPIHTSPAPPADGRTLINEPADVGGGSPYGWHDTDGSDGPEFTTTQGNTVHAYTDTDANNLPDPGSSPDGGPGLDFNFPITLSQAPSTYQPAAVTNLFVWNNLMHDVNYRYGFDEASGNFQENNYGNGGLGSDYVNAEAQDGSGVNNANFATPADGFNPRMQMFIGTNPTPDVDGDLDNGVIAHEYGHGISNRLTGGPASAGCLSNTEQMGEGWSDWQALFMTMETGDAGTDARGIGTYLFGQPANGPGIRPAPYSTDTGVNNFTYSDISTVSIPHGVGFVWATMLWDMNWALIDEYGFDEDVYKPSATPLSGNQLAHQLITDGMKLQPCSPGFVDGRDAILAADLALTGGVNQCTIWTAFADRGLGYSADQGSTNSVNDGTEAFDLPPGCLTVDLLPESQSICQGDSAIYTTLVGENFSTPVNLTVSGHPASTTAVFDTNPITSLPDATDLTISNTAGAAGGDYTLIITATDGVLTDTATSSLYVFDGAPIAPSLTSPADEAVDVAQAPTLTWAAVPDATEYLVEIATDSAFTTVVYTATESTTSHDVSVNLADFTTHYWRVSGNNLCGYGTTSEVFSFTTIILPGTCVDNAVTEIAYTTDLEDGAPGWTHSGTQDTWTLSSANTTSGSNAWFAQDLDTLSDQRLVSPAIVLPDISESPITLRFENRQIFEVPNGDGRCWDAGILEISTNGGSTWSQVPQSAMLTDSYDNILWNDTPGNNPISNDYGAAQAWCDPGDPASWVTSVVDLDAYAGETVHLRWRLGTDSFVGNEGWYIDDVTVQSCHVPDYNVAVSSDMAQSGDAGSTVTYAVHITNTGSLTETFDLDIAGNVWTTTPDMPTVTLGINESSIVSVTVDIPIDANDAEMDTATFTATSQTDDQVSDSADLVTTAVGPQRIYLPVVLKP